MYNNAKEAMMRHKKLFVWMTAIFLVLILIITAYFLDYRLTQNWTVGKVGVVKINTELQNTSIFINQDEKIITTKDNQTTEIKFSPRKHSILVWKEGYFPWKKDVTVPSNNEVILNPILIYQSPSGLIITNNDPEYWSIRNSIIRYELPREENKLKSEDGLSEVWVTLDNEIILQNGSSTISVLHPDTVINNVSFYKNRNDVLIFSTSNAIYAIEASKEGGQNFMPIYKGQRPEFINSEDNFIYVLDVETLMQVVI